MNAREYLEGVRKEIGKALSTFKRAKACPEDVSPGTIIFARLELKHGLKIQAELLRDYPELRRTRVKQMRLL